MAPPVERPWIQLVPSVLAADGSFNGAPRLNPADTEIGWAQQNDIASVRVMMYRIADTRARGEPENECGKQTDKFPIYRPHIHSCRV